MAGAAAEAEQLRLTIERAAQGTASESAAPGMRMRRLSVQSELFALFTAEASVAARLDPIKMVGVIGLDAPPYARRSARRRGRTT
mmetsp:Transcript_14999/g.34908  ORF Transcript_14999/g.34908 Transcript_14999/m.34908 type:complete len:85 (+) Transcript_14999:244-498(+)